MTNADLIERLERALAGGPSGVVTMGKIDARALLSAAREGEKLREALLIARRYVADMPLVGDADLAKIDAALQSETPHE